MSAEKWVQLDLDTQKLLKENIPFPHALNANSFANCVKGTNDQIFDKYMPEKERPINPKYKDDRPWITSGLKTSINKKFELFRISKKTGLDEDLSLIHI